MPPAGCEHTEFASVHRESRLTPRGDGSAGCVRRQRLCLCFVFPRKKKLPCPAPRAARSLHNVAPGSFARLLIKKKKKLKKGWGK